MFAIKCGVVRLSIVVVPLSAAVSLAGLALENRLPQPQPLPERAEQQMIDNWTIYLNRESKDQARRRERTLVVHDIQNGSERSSTSLY